MHARLHAPRPSAHRPRRPARRARPLAHGARGVVAVLLGVASVLAVGAPAADAQDALRTRSPVVAGTQITNASGTVCTAGPVLVSHSIPSYVVPAYSATRYVLTAKHCNPLHAAVTLGSDVRGTVSWVSPDHDVELITVPPASRARQVCSSSSYGPYCHVISEYQPLAIGAVIAPAPYSRVIQPIVVPVTGVGTPAAGESFCTSGRTTGVICGFKPGAVPATWTSDDSELAAGDAAVGNVAGGDSGGPVLTSSGRLYGMVLGYGNYGGVDKMLYQPMTSITRMLPYYGLAPAATR